MTIVLHGLSRSTSTYSLPTSHLLFGRTLPPLQSSSTSPIFLQRHASTSTTTSPKPIALSSAINPPPSTLPPPLTLPTRTPSQSAINYYFTLGRTYLSFYKAGLKAVYTNHTLARPLLARVPSSTPLSTAVHSGLLTRAEFQLIRRSRADVRKIPLFALVFIICGEFTPLVVLAMGGVVPGTCRVPRQVEGERRKREERRKASFREGTVRTEENARKGGVEALAREQVLHVGRSLGLYPRWADRVGGYPTALLRGRVRRWIEYLEADDVGLEKGGGIGGLDVEEVRIALEERGVDVLGKGEKVMRDELRAWLRAKRREPVTRMLLTRPNVWGVKG